MQLLLCLNLINLVVDDLQMKLLRSWMNHEQDRYQVSGFWTRVNYLGYRCKWTVYSIKINLGLWGSEYTITAPAYSIIFLTYVWPNMNWAIIYDDNTIWAPSIVVPFLRYEFVPHRLNISLLTSIFHFLFKHMDYHIACKNYESIVVKFLSMLTNTL